MLNRILSLAVLLSAAAGITAFAMASSGSERSDCPGKIVCPLTGGLVCKDRCPLDQTAERNDCPGRIVCPLTGAPVCKDRCPLGETAAAAPLTQRPPCCRGRN